MDNLTLHTEKSFLSTSVSNIFIDCYMPAASGSFVKVYLYLLRCLSQTPESFSISYLADRLEETEKDILRALKYWEKVQLLTLATDEQGNIRSITLLSPKKPEEANGSDFLTATTPTLSEAAADTAVAFSTVVSDTVAASSLAASDTAAFSGFETVKKPVLPEKPVYTAQQIANLSSNDEVKWMTNIIEVYLERPLKPKDVQLILYLYDSLHFSTDLIMYLYEYCISKGKKSSSYIEAVALSWAEQGIQTVEEAETASVQYNSGYSAVSKAFGLNRTPAPAERRYIDKWISHYNFSLEIISEACSRTLLNTQKPDFKYADRILENWHKKDVKSTADIKQLDSAFNASKQTQAAPETQSKAANRFNAFPQRNYSKEDYSHMEKELLRRQLQS